MRLRSSPRPTVLVPFALVPLSSGMSRVASLEVILLQDLEEGSTGPQDPQATLAPHERLPEILGVPREKTPTGAAARGNP